jgi:uncharacterized lipoprotein YbaY
MKTSKLIFFLAACAALFTGSGCGNISVTPEGDPNRVISGRVTFRSDLVLPPDAVVVVRLLDTAATAQARSAANQDLPVVSRPKADLTPQVLGEQTIKAPAPGPVPFRIEYQAPDSLLRHGLNLEARISYGGQVRLRTVMVRAVTLGNATDPHDVSVQPVGR